MSKVVKCETLTLNIGDYCLCEVMTCSLVNTSNVSEVHSVSIFSTLKMEATGSSEASTFSNSLHDFWTQKTVFVVLTSVRNSNSTY